MSYDPKFEDDSALLPGNRGMAKVLTGKCETKYGTIYVNTFMLTHFAMIPMIIMAICVGVLTLVAPEVLQVATQEERDMRTMVSILLILPILFCALGGGRLLAKIFPWLCLAFEHKYGFNLFVLKE